MYKKYTLNNGMRVILAPMPHMESVSIGIWIGVGGRHERKDLSGMSHIIEHMLFKGTLSRTANMLKETIEGVGGSFNAFTAEEETCFLVKLPSQYVRRGLDILSDMVLNPKLDSAELEKEKNVICEEIKMYMDQPAHHVFDILAETMWPNHALGRPIAGTINTVKKFSRNGLINFKNQYYQPANMLVVATGKINSRNILSFAKDTFSMPKTKSRFSYKKVKKDKKAPGIKIFHKSTKQTHIAIGFHSTHRTHRLRYAVSLLHIILGGNMSSRLFDRLREKKALCYDISSSVKRYKETGAFIIHAGVDNDKLVGATEEIIHEIRDIKENPVLHDELHRAREYARGQLIMALDDTASRMIWLGEKIMSQGKAPSIKEIFKNLEKVKAGDIKESANIIFKSKNMNLATIGPVSHNSENKLRKVLKV